MRLHLQCTFLFVFILLSYVYTPIRDVYTRLPYLIKISYSSRSLEIELKIILTEYFLRTGSSRKTTLSLPIFQWLIKYSIIRIVIRRYASIP